MAWDDNDEIQLPELQTDHASVLVAVSQDGRALQDACSELQSDRTIVLAAVSQDGRALHFAADELRSDREIVLAAVTQDGAALQYASSELLSDRTIVLAAVSQYGPALSYAADELRSDQAIVVAAIAQDARALQHADEMFLEDATFAPEARDRLFLFHLVALSGRSCYISFPSDLYDYAGCLKNYVMDEACRKLDIQPGRANVMLHGEEIVPDGLAVPAWPGSPAPGKLVTYQLVCQTDSLPQQ
mmetsp:Transcript_48167/g.112671  ORF Transcript_48167/g.112671 Transcript_48167/m.112671 type:complete len:244 (-) Transcript_48167:62-793(-)